MTEFMPKFSRISRHQWYMELAQSTAKRSTCMRLNVGAVIVKDRTPISFGYNGTPPGDPHCGGNSCPGRLSCRETVHAEDNALRRLPPGTQGPLDIYVTDSPCAACYDHLVSDGRFSRLFFGTPYRITDHLVDSLFEPTMSIYRITPAGFIIDWSTQRMVDIEV